MKTLRERFDEKYIPEPNTGCFLWTAACNNKGYGVFRYLERQHLAHRFNWELSYGQIQCELNVLHRCDTPLCVNPSHLFLGTQKDNARDMILRKRHSSQKDPDAWITLMRTIERPKGERHYKAKLTDDNVKEIRASSLSITQLGRIYGVSIMTIHDVRARKTWRHL